MSQSKYTETGKRWIATAQDDLQAAKILAAQGMHSHACFLAQQCAEKAVKALWYFTGSDPWGHSIQKLLAEFPKIDTVEKYKQLLSKAASLDRYYIATRYPNGLPDLTPQQNYFREDADTAIKTAGYLFNVCNKWSIKNIPLK